MANVQTRRSISFAAADFEAAQKLATLLGVPVAQLAGQALRDFTDRHPSRGEISPYRSIADQVVIDGLRPDSPFRYACRLAGCGAVPGQACRPVPLEDGKDPELAESVVHVNRIWQVPAPAPTTAPAEELQRQIDERVGVLPRGNVGILVEHGSPLDQMLREELRTDHLPVQVLRGPYPETWSEISRVPGDEMDDPPDTMAGPRATAEPDHPDAGEVRVVYDEES